jgi:toxin YoeB
VSGLALLWVEESWEDYLYWQQADRRILARINRLIAEARRTPEAGIGKPEPLRENWSGWWSRRIPDEHRLIYRVRDGCLEIAACRYHY